MTDEIIRLAKEEKVLEQLCGSLFPNILGHEKIKKILVLQMFGESDQFGNIHILLRGNLSSAKTEMMRNLKRVFPENSYLSLIRDNGKITPSGESKAKIIYIDDVERMKKEQKREIEKITEQRGNRKGVAILAVSNNEEFEYIKTNQFSEEFLTKFDIIFEIDKDLELEKRIASKILKEEKIKNPEINIEIIRGYLEKARNIETVRLSQEAKEHIARFYGRIRIERSRIGTPRFNARQIESIAKLAVSHAKLELRDTVTENDAIKAIRLFRSIYPEIEESVFPVGSGL